MRGGAALAQRGVTGRPPTREALVAAINTIITPTREVSPINVATRCSVSSAVEHDHIELTASFEKLLQNTLLYLLSQATKKEIYRVLQDTYALSLCHVLLVLVAHALEAVPTGVAHLGMVVIVVYTCCELLKAHAGASTESVARLLSMGTLISAFAKRPTVSGEHPHSQ